MKLKTSTLIGPALKWAVAVAEDKVHDCEFHASHVWYGRVTSGFVQFNPDTDWLQGGPIIEREKINVKSNLTRNFKYPEYDWMADCPEKGFCVSICGPTPLIAVMRCYVASKLGDIVEIPNELIT